jgi:hypothetical protein
MHLLCRHRGHRGHLGLDDRLEHLHPDHQILEPHLGEEHQSQHLLDVERLLDEVRRPGEDHPDLGDLRHRDEGHHLDVGHGPCPGLS